MLGVARPKGRATPNIYYRTFFHQGAPELPEIRVQVHLCQNEKTDLPQFFYCNRSVYRLKRTIWYDSDK